MAGSYYDQDRTKRLLEIATGDASDDTLLDELGLVADQHIDNILIAHDEKIPLQSTNVLNDVKEMAALFTASIYKGKRGDEESAKFFKELYKELLDGMVFTRGIQDQPYIVERFNSRFITGQEDIFALW